MTPRSTFTIEVYEHGLGIRGRVPLSLLSPLLDGIAKSEGYDLLDTGVSQAMGLLMFLTNKAGAEAARAEIAAGLVGIAPLDAWLRGTDTGLSSRTIVGVLTGRRGISDGSVPRDPADFGRCHRLLDLIPEFRPRLPEVADRWPAWAPIVAAWDELTGLYLEELPTGRCPRLYARMRELTEGSR